MSRKTLAVRTGLAESARSIAIGAWLVAAVSLPAALLLGSYGLVLLIAILVGFWQLLALVMSALLPTTSGGSRFRFRYRLTPWGIVYGAIVVTFCVVSLQWGVNLLYLTAAFLLAGALYTALFARLTLSRLGARWDLPGHVFAGSPFSVELALRNDKRLISALGLSVATASDGFALGGVRHIARLAPRAERRLLLRQYLPRRGLHRLPSVQLSTAFPFGLVQAAMEARLEQEVLVLPRLGHINQDLLRRQKGGEARWMLNLRRKDQQGEFRSLREYKHGDNPRHIHWPTSARLKKLHVREFERREMHRLLILLDAHMPAADRAETSALLDRFEQAVSFAATLAALLNEQNVFHAFASYCPDLVALPYDLGPGHFFSVLETLALAEPTPQRTLGDLARALSYHEVSTGGVCLVSPGPLARQEAEAALGPLTPYSVCIDVSEPEFHALFSS